MKIIAVQYKGHTKENFAFEVTFERNGEVYSRTLKYPITYARFSGPNLLHTVESDLFGILSGRTPCFSFYKCNAAHDPKDYELVRVDD